MRQNSVPANHNILPDRWWLDEHFREETYAKIDRMQRQGFSKQDIARQTGVSDRSILRITQRWTAGKQPAYCEAMTHRGSPCTVRVREPEDRCHWHRDTDL